MKKLTFVLVSFLTAAFAFSQSYSENEYQALADDFIARAQQAFDEGNFELAESLSDEAEKNAALSREYVQSSIIKSLAQRNIGKAKEKREWAKSIGGDKNFPMSFESAENAIALADEKFAAESFDEANKSALEALECYNSMSEVVPLPQYYVVKPWAESHDCFWTISGRPYIYNNSALWENLYRANKDKMRNPNNPNLIYPAMRMFIPSIAGELREGEYDPAKQYAPFEKK